MLDSRHRNKVHDIPRHSSGRMDDGPGSGMASVPMARQDPKDDVRTDLAITPPKAEQSCAEILKTMERSEGPRPYGLTASGQVRHAGRAIPPGATDSLSGDQARLEQNRKTDAACLNSRPPHECRVCETGAKRSGGTAVSFPVLTRIRQSVTSSPTQEKDPFQPFGT